MDLGLSGRRALVLASSSGLGRAVASGLAAEGARVAVCGRDADKVEAVAASIPQAVPLTGDLTQAGVPEQLVCAAKEALRGLDILVVNTGGGKPGGLLDADDGDDMAAFQGMLRPALQAARAAATALAASPAGRLVFLTARSILEPTAQLALSAVFRSGVAAAARSLALELAPHVLVNVVVPGQFETPALQRFEAWYAQRHGIDQDQARARHVDDIPMGRIGRAEELADVVVFLCSERASYVTGSVVRVDGGAAHATGTS